MEYNLCKDYDNMLHCDFDCRKCANLVYDTLTEANKRLKAELKKTGEIRAQECNEYIEKCAKLDKEREKLREKCAKLEKENDYLDQECESLLAKFSERIAELEKEREKLRDDNSRLAHGFKDYIASTSELAKECDELRMMNDELRTMNSDLLYRNRLLMETTGPVATYEPVNDAMTDEKEDTVLDAVTIEKKLQELTEDIIRLDKCLSNRQCVQLERIKEEDHA